MLQLFSSLSSYDLEPCVHVRVVELGVCDAH